MATTVNRRARQFSDFSLLFNSHPATADVVAKYDEEAVKQSLRNLISTRHYERPFHPEIGCQIHALLFENITPFITGVMKQTIVDVINKFEPRVVLDTVDVNAQPDNNGVAITVYFRMKNTNRPVTLKTTLTRVR